jgi:hypothetical protein
MDIFNSTPRIPGMIIIQINRHTTPLKGDKVIYLFLLLFITEFATCRILIPLSIHLFPYLTYLTGKKQQFLLGKLVYLNIIVFNYSAPYYNNFTKKASPQ